MTRSIHIERIPNDWVVAPPYMVHAKNFEEITVD